jgi:ferredoxin-NADP reductase
MQANTFALTLEESYMITPNVKHFIFKLPQDIDFTYLPGQFITIYFEHQGQSLHRSYSIANAPTNRGYIELAAGRIENGPGTTLLFNLKPNDTVYAKGPFGRLILKETSPKRYVLVATSTGITPYRAMLPDLQKIMTHHALEVVILQGVQTRSDLLYHEEFKAFANEHQNITYTVYLSREKSALIELEHSGYVQHAFPTLNLLPSHDIVYLCGNPSMVDDAFEWLKTHEFSTSQIVREKYISR